MNPGREVLNRIDVQNDPVIFVDPEGEAATIVGGIIGGGIAGGVAGGIVGAASSWVAGDSVGGIVKSGLVGAGIGAIAGGVAGGFLGAGLPGGLGLIGDLGWGFDLGLLGGEGAALAGKLGAAAGAFGSIFTDPGIAYGELEPCP